jgi:hypothetical protein
MDPAAPFDDPDLDNPYAPPQSTFVPETTTTPQFAGIPFTVSDVFNWSWETFKNRLWPCIYIFWGAVGINWGISFAQNMLVAVMTAVIHEQAFFQGINFLLAIVSMVIQVWLGIGMALGLLKIARGEPVSFDVLFSGGRYLVTAILASIVVALLVGAVVVIPAFVLGVAFYVLRDQGSAGVIAIVLGGALIAVLVIYLAARVGQFYYLVIDRNAGVIDSIRLSWQLTEGRAGTIILVYLLQFLLALAGVIALCVGLIFTLPLANLMQIVTYLALAGTAKPDTKVPLEENWEADL